MVMFTPAMPITSTNAARIASRRPGFFALPAISAITRIAATPTSASRPERDSVSASVTAASTAHAPYAAADFIFFSAKLAYASSAAAVAMMMQDMDRQFAS